jgi:phosphoribosylpyrophosphate synthetase
MTQIIIYKNGAPEHFKIIKYPDGQQSVQLNLEMLDVKKPVSIKCRIRNFKELEILYCLVRALQQHDFRVQHIQFVYLFGMRSDRSFDNGEVSYFKGVIAPILKSLSPHIEFSIFQPHSHSNLYDLNANQSFIYDLQDFVFLENKIIIAGDESTIENVYIDYDNSYFCAFEKHRRMGGKISCVLSDEDLHELDALIQKKPNAEIIIVDDLCDAGGTFITESEYLKSRYSDIRLYLFVVHGLFTKGPGHVAQHFEHIYTTNSYSNKSHPKMTRIEVI